MAKKIIIKKKPSYNLTEMQNTQLEFALIKEQKKQLEQREKELRGRLDEFMTATLKPDSKGHYLFTTINEKGEKIHLQKQARKKINLDRERAIKYLKKNGYKALMYEDFVIAEEVTQDQIIEVLEKHAPEFLDKVVLVDEAGLEQAVLNEEIPMEDFESLCDIEISYAMAFVKDSLLEEGE